MIYSDYHLHTKFSSDSTAEMTDMIDKAVSLGLKEIMFTDHMDIDFPDRNMPFCLYYPDYSDAINLYKVLYMKKIDVLIGVEMGLQKHIVMEADMFTKYNPFDFVIGSTHVIDGVDVSDKKFFDGLSKKEAFTKYFESVLENAKLHNCYNVYGHIDYVNRYAPYEDKEVNYSEFREIIDEILKTIAEKGKGLDVNTSGYRYGNGRPYPQLEILKRFKELGGEIITIGSDAHKPEDIAYRFEDAYEIVKAAGFKAIASFRNKTPKFIDIK